MKINIFARPDHSIYLYKYLRKIYGDKDINLYTFYVFRSKGILNKLFPKRKCVSSDINTFDIFTLLSYTNMIIGKKIGYNWRIAEQSLAEYFVNRKILFDCDILHYWPFYIPKSARLAKLDFKISTVAEIYEADPLFVNALYDSEYKKFKLKTSNHINLMINQDEVFEFETNFIVPSEYTKATYLERFPDKHFYVCSYGSGGYKISPSIDSKISNSIARRLKKIVYVGQISIEKGVHYLIEAANMSGFDLILIGPIN